MIWSWGLIAIGVFLAGVLTGARACWLDAYEKGRRDALKWPAPLTAVWPAPAVSTWPPAETGSAYITDGESVVRPDLTRTWVKPPPTTPRPRPAPLGPTPLQ